MVNGYKISSERKDMDFSVIYSYLSSCYWATGIPKETLQRAIDNSFCFGVFTATDEQVGFARVVTDYATHAYLADVFILEAHRGRGLSKWLVAEIMRHPDLQGLRRFNLVTKDAHGLYDRFGFKRLESTNGYMEVVNMDVYKNNQR